MTSANFLETEGLDSKWETQAETEVCEPEDEYERAARTDSLRSAIAAAFLDPVGEDVMVETNLIRFLRSCSWDVEEALAMFLDVVQHHKEFSKFQDLPASYSKIKDSSLMWVSPDRDSTGSRVVFVRLGQWDPYTFPTESLYSLSFALFQLVSMEPRTQVAGVIIVADLNGFGFKHLRAMGIQELRCLGSFLSGGFPIKFRNIHIVNNPRLFNTLFSILRGFLSERIKDCFKFHGYTTTELVTALPPSLLPQELGGSHTEAELHTSHCIESLQEQEELLVEMNNQLTVLAKARMKGK